MALAGLAAGVEVRTHWLGGTYLAWAFTGDWARLSNGEQAVWIGTTPGALEAGKLTLHDGSRGPLTLEHVATLPEGTGARWWVFRCDTASGWEPPSLAVEGDVLKVRVPGAETDTWVLP